MVITYSVPELMSIGETVLDMDPQEWLVQQQQLAELFINQQQQQQQQQQYQQSNDYEYNTLPNNIIGPTGNTHTIIDSTIDEQQQFLNNFVMLNQLNNLSHQQQPPPPPLPHQHQMRSRSMTADTLFNNLSLLHQKIGLTKPQEPYVSTLMNHQPAKDIIMSKFQQHSNLDTSAQLTEPVANFFRMAQQTFRPEFPTRVRRLSDVEAELIGQRYPTSSS